MISRLLTLAAVVASAAAFRAPTHPVTLSHAKSMFGGAPLARASAQAPRVAKVSTANTAGAGGLVMMPIGVPKVAYRVPGSPSADWVDIYNRLYRERIIFLGQEIDDEIANQVSHHDATYLLGKSSWQLRLPRPPRGEREGGVAARAGAEHFPATPFA